MQPDSYPLDHSGHGPTGMGKPTARDMRTQQMNRFRSDRMSGGMQFVDPYVTAAVETMMRGFVANGDSPDEVRRAAFQSSGGQIAMDVAMDWRRSGMLGQGNPVNYAHNISRGIAAGGFQTTFGGRDEDGRQVHGRGHVSGSGALSERVSTSFQKSLLKDLYGSGLPDPSKQHGFDMEETSRTFQMLASRGVVGEVAHVERNASLGTRMAAAREQAVDRSVKSALASVQLEGLSEEQGLEELEKVITATKDPKQRRALESVRDAKDAPIMNADASKKVAKIVDAVQEGMAGLIDIYGAMTDTELRSKLEEVSGMRITSETQARQATEMVSQMRGAAKAVGMDPYAYAEYSAHQQGLLQGEVMEAFGFDGRTATESINTTAVLQRQMFDSAGVASKISQQDAMRARESGIDAGEGKTHDEIYEDKRQGRLEFAKKYKAVAFIKGGMDNFVGDQRERVEGLMSEFEATSDISDPQKQAEARALIKSQMEGEIGDLYGGDFAMAETAHSFQMAIADAYSTPQNAREMEKMAMDGRHGNININPAVKMLEAMQIDGAKAQAVQFRDKLGLGGMDDLLRESRNDGTVENPVTAADRLQQQRNILSQAGIEGEEADEFMDRFFNDEGRMKDEEGFAQVAGVIGRSDRGDGHSEYARKKIGVERMAAVGDNSNRTKLRAEDQTVSLNSIVTSLLTGDMQGISDPESMALMMQSMADAGIAVPEFHSTDKDGNPIMKSAANSYATGIDFSGGLNKEGLDKLEGLHGKSLDLHTKMGFGSREEMIAASEKDENVTADALELMRTDEDYVGLNMQGDQYNLTAITDEAKDALKETGELDSYARKLGGAKLINRSLGMTDEQQAAALTAGGEFDASRFEADEFEKVKGKWLAPGDPRTEMGEGLGRVLNLSGLIDDSGAESMKSIASLDEDQELTSKLQAQYDELEKAKIAGGKKGGDMMVEFKGDGGNSESTTIDEAMKGIADAMTKLSEAKATTNSPQAVEEMTVKVLRVENSTTVN
jgi:hypothetical protein